jgi:hypothetical protein
LIHLLLLRRRSRRWLLGLREDLASLLGKIVSRKRVTKGVFNSLRRGWACRVISA